MVDGFLGWSLRAVMISVQNLDRSASFYQEVMGVRDVQREGQIAIVGGLNEACTVYLREAYRDAAHPGRDALGLRSFFLTVGSFDELDRVEQFLRDQDSLRDRQVFDDIVRLEAVRGYDPDRLPLTFVAHDAGRKLSPADLLRVGTVMYSIDL